jgi:photosystem II stability/assembly factor-like uncharacterized protein
MKLTVYCLTFGIIAMTLPLHAQQWQLQSSYPNIEFNDIHFISTDTGYVFGDSSLSGAFIKGVVMRTIDQGATWFELNFGSPDYRVFDSYIIGNNIYAAGRSAAGGGNLGLFVRSTDGGNSWQNATTFPERMYTVGFLDSQTGWTGGKNGYLIKTTDGGISWSAPLNLTGEDILDIAFFNTTTGLIACGGGELYRTADGGLTWTLVASNVPEDLTAVAIAGSNQAYICGTAGTVTMSSDMGQTWIPQASGSGFDLEAITFYDAVHGFIGGVTGTTLYTASGGNAWSSLTTNCTTDISSMSVINATSGWFCTIEGDIYKLANPTGITDPASQLPVNLVWPNPVLQYASVQLPESGSDIFIYNTSGKIIYSAYSVSGLHQLCTIGYPAGLYILEIHSGKAILHDRLIIQ